MFDQPEANPICPACGATRTTEARVCSQCQSNLASAGNRGPKPKPSRWQRFATWLQYNKLRALLIVGVALLLLVWLGPGIVSAAFPKQILLPTSNISPATGWTAWPLIRGNGAQTAYIENVPKLPEGNLKWTFSIGSPAYSSPVVANGKVFVGSSNSRLYALDAGTGELIWEYTTTGPVIASPAVAGQYVYVGLLDGRLIALDADSGKQRWEFRTAGNIASAANVSNGVVYLGAGDYNFYAIDAATGANLWVYRAKGWMSSSPAVAAGEVAVGSSDGVLHILDARTGVQRFEYTSNVWPEASPTIVGDRVFVGGSDGKMRAIDTTARASGLEKIRPLWNLLYLYGFPLPVPSPPPGLVWGFQVKDRLSSGAAFAGDKV
ncbi:MAG: PQQ-binding-like beta-propeller repeat protein [Dehalococcoidia bacterium]|nr:PQQ-binding-like beta-propeller repeat protein [Dehalococcoidia bacterium]